MPLGVPAPHPRGQMENDLPSHDSEVGAQDLLSLMSFPKLPVRGAQPLRAARLSGLATMICHFWPMSNLISCLSE